MKRALVFLLLFGLLPLPRAAAPSAPKAIVIPEATPVLLLTEEKMVSGETPEGSVILYKVERDVLGPQGEVLIPAGSRAHGKVLKSSGSGFFGRAGELNISIDSVDAADKTLVPLRAVRNATGDDPMAGMIVGAVLLSVFFVFMEGDDVTIPAQTLFSGYVNRDTNIPVPLPARARLASATAQITLPASGGKIKKEDKLNFACAVNPPDSAAYVRLYVDDTLVAWQKGDLHRLVWDTTRNEKVVEKLCAEGEHTAVTEVTLASGQIVKSPPVKFTIVD